MIFFWREDVRDSGFSQFEKEAQRLWQRKAVYAFSEKRYSAVFRKHGAKEYHVVVQHTANSMLQKKTFNHEGHEEREESKKP